MTFMPLLMLASCAGVGPDVEDPDAIQSGDGPSILVRIGAMGARTSGNSISEKIKTLRIIMLSDGFIETNQLIDYERAEGSTAGVRDADIFTQKYDRVTVAGNKKFYLIANEESVAELKFDEDTELPDWWKEGMTLKDLLDHYSKDTLPSEGTVGSQGSDNGEELERLLSEAYFTPDYTVADNAIYLPYTAMYDNIKATNDMSVKITKTMYLVPVATKFTFNFYNYRKEKVEVQEIHLEKIASQSYLMARLGEEELIKSLDGETYYWIDWLQMVSGGSQGANGSLEYNNKAGWIQNYFLPGLTKGEDTSSTIDIFGGGEDWTIDKLTDKDRPNTLTLTKYFPETKNMGKKTVYNSETNQHEEVDAQVYKVWFKIEEIRDGVVETEPFTSEPMELDVVNALFRSTHVVIDIDMFESIVEIYCEIAEWNLKKFQGYVDAEDD